MLMVPPTEGAESMPAPRLDAGGHVAQTGPVAPVNAAPFHVVDGYTVDNHSHVFALETAHVGFGVAETAAVLGGPHAGSGFQHFGKFLVAEFEFDFRSVDLRKGYRSFAGACQRLCDNHVGKHLRFHFHFQDAHVGFCGFFQGLVTDVGDSEVARAVGHIDLELAVDVGRTERLAAACRDGGSDDRFIRFINNGTH